MISPAVWFVVSLLAAAWSAVVWVWGVFLRGWPADRVPPWCGWGRLVGGGGQVAVAGAVVVGGSGGCGWCWCCGWCGGCGVGLLLGVDGGASGGGEVDGGEDGGDGDAGEEVA